MADDPVSIVFDEENQRSEAYDGGRLIGECELLIVGNVWTITHTGVRPEYGGRGIAKKLVEKVIEEARKEGAKVLPLCSYAKKLMEGNEAYRDVM